MLHLIMTSVSWLLWLHVTGAQLQAAKEEEEKALRGERGNEEKHN